MDFEGSNTPMDSNDPRSELIYHNDTIYEDWIGSKFIFVYKGVLAIKQDYTKDSEQGLWIELID